MEALQTPSRNNPLFPSLLLPHQTLKKYFSLVWVVIGAILLFEIFNYSTTEHALSDTMGNLGFLGIRLATILALAFCGIDFAGVARLFSREEHIGQEREEEWFLLSAWLMAGLINAIMTWWSVSETLMAQPNIGNELLARQTMIVYVPIFVAGAIWIIRILLIGSLTLHIKQWTADDNQSVKQNSPFTRSGKLPTGSSHVHLPIA